MQTGTLNELTLIAVPMTAHGFSGLIPRGDVCACAICVVDKITANSEQQISRTYAFGEFFSVVARFLKAMI